VEPFQGSVVWHIATQGAPKRRPWAIECNPVGVKTPSAIRFVERDPVAEKTIVGFFC
jgi:hypothetical protein